MVGDGQGFGSGDLEAGAGGGLGSPGEHGFRGVNAQSIFREAFEGAGGNAGAAADIESVGEGLGAPESGECALENEGMDGRPRLRVASSHLVGAEGVCHFVSIGNWCIFVIERASGWRHPPPSVRLQFEIELDSGPASPD